MVSLLLSQAKLAAFLTCRQRFYRAALWQSQWPGAPLPDDTAEQIARGKQFHRLLERHFLGLPTDPADNADAQVQQWWRAFQRRPPALPPGRRLPEHRLTLPIGNHLLHGRFDLLIAGETEAGQPYAHLYDWKTGKARREGHLRQDWQTRLYLALLAEGGGALWQNGRSPTPDQITITYWYASEPDNPRVIPYSAPWHKENWADIQAIVAQIEAALAADEWPLTDDLGECRRCAYQVICGRQVAGPPSPPPPDEAETPEELDFLALEPQTP
jgi:hypothetical protein